MIIEQTGWTWDYIDEYLTMPRATALFDFWFGSRPTARPGRELRTARVPGLSAGGPLPSWANAKAKG